MNTTTETQQQVQAQRVLRRVEDGLISGRYFYLIAASNRSVPLGDPPITGRHWAAIMQAVACYATGGDRRAQVASRIFGRVNLYATPNEVVAQVAERLAKVTRDGYRDVIGATGPEAGRPSQYQHPTDLRTALDLALLMVECEMAAGYIGHVPGVGWALRDLLTREHVAVSATLFPRVHQSLARRS